MTPDDTDTAPFEFGTEITFTLRDASYPIVRISERLDCRVDIVETIRPVTNGAGIVEFIHVDSALAERVRVVGESPRRTDQLRILQAGDEQTLAELSVVDSVAETVADAKGILLTGHAEGGACTFAVFVPPDRDSSTAIDTVMECHPVVEVAALNKHPIAAPLLSVGNFDSLLENRLTDRQWEILQLAHENGYFERPRGVHQTEIARRLGISQETVSQHLRAAQRRLLSTVFDEVLPERFER